MSIVTTSAKGQVVIPKREREKVGIKPGTKVIAKGVEDHIEIRPLPEKAVESYCGIFKKGSSLTKDLLRERKRDFEREEKIVLDSFALLAYLKKEGGFEKVKRVLAAEDAHLLMNDINVGEVCYIVARERGLVQADDFVDVILPSLPINLVANSLRETIEAARIKTRYPLAYADCFAVATANREKAPLMTGNPEFKRVQEIIEIDWL